jgi:cytidylate kinase
MIIAVDGPAAAGKGTVARALARHFGYHFLDTGLLYRMVGLAVLRGGGDPNDRAAAIRAAQTLRPRTYRDEDLRGEDVGKAASIVAVIAEVRSALLGLQREFARKPPGAVLDGRDIGTVVCPDAEENLYITAAPEVRARRRMLELAERGTAVLPETVLAEIRDRDERDRSRAAAPLVAAADAIVIDTSAMGIEEAVAAAIAAAMNRHHANPRKG